MLRFDTMVQVPAVEMAGSILTEVPIRRQDLNKWAAPPTWAHQHQEVQVEPVSATSSDYQRVQNLLVQEPFSAGEVRIVKLERIQNKTLLKRYQTERDIATERRGAGGLNEQYVFHGTRGHAPLKIAESPEGFLVEASRGVANPSSPCLYGIGCYFAHSARYSHHYAHKVAADGQPWQQGQPEFYQLLVVQMICGKSKVYSGGHVALDMDRMKLTDVFDSVQGGEWCVCVD